MNYCLCVCFGGTERFFNGFRLTLISALIASSKLNGCNETGLAFGMDLPPMANAVEHSSPHTSSEHASAGGANGILRGAQHVCVESVTTEPGTDSKASASGARLIEQRWTCSTQSA